MCSTFCSPPPPCLPHHPEDSLIALCLSFLRTLHTNRMSGLKIIHTTKRNEGEAEQQEGSRRLGLRHASSRSLARSVMPVEGGGRSGSPGWPSTSARHLESGFVVSRFSFVHNAPRGRMKRVKETEAKSWSAVRQSPLSFLLSCPRDS